MDPHQEQNTPHGLWVRLSRRLKKRAAANTSTLFFILFPELWQRRRKRHASDAGAQAKLCVPKRVKSDEEKVDDLLDRLKTIEKRRKRLLLQSVFRGLCSGIIVFVVFRICASIAGDGMLYKLAHINMYINAVTSMIIGFFTLRQQSRKERDKFTRLLAEFDDIRTVGPLITALESKDALTLSAIKPALTRLLPDLKPDEARLLDDRQRQCLYRMLEPANADGEDAPLLAAILIALGKMEDEAAIPYVTHLAQGKVYTSRGRQIQDQARQCRTLLQQCAERRQMSQTLLRAAQSSEPPGNILLRPASGVPATDPDQLLRASLSAENQ